ncbi:MAG TPA: methionine--tRNA ligase subunit beta, partial [Catalimonadaceae bacterium]|nr:methionine--tRNA ligase subunit beta [Catalimonadaceae bacterium]
EIMNLARAGNKYLAETEPWKIIKSDPERVGTILNLALQTCGALTQLMEPFLPFSTAKMRKMLPEVSNQWPEKDQTTWFENGQTIGQAEILFTKITDEEVQSQLEKLEKSKLENALANYKAAPQKEAIDFENFGKMDIRVASIVAAEVVPKTKKLLKLTLNTGIDERTVVSGIAEHYKPEEIIGQQVLLLANLAPRELKGITSQGMILMAQDADGKLVFVQPQSSVKPGSQVS